MIFEENLRKVHNLYRGTAVFSFIGAALMIAAITASAGKIQISSSESFLLIVRAVCGVILVIDFFMILLLKKKLFSSQRFAQVENMSLAVKMMFQNGIMLCIFSQTGLILGLVCYFISRNHLDLIFFISAALIQFKSAYLPLSDWREMLVMVKESSEG